MSSPFFISFSLALCLLLPVGLDCVPLEDFFPFGSDNGDAKLPSGSTAHVTVDLPVPFVFYEQHYDQIHISVNGLISFIDPVIAYSPDVFPLDTPIIAPFQADADTGGMGGGGINNVWYNVANEESLAGNMAAEQVALYFNDLDFVPKGVATVTWYKVGYFQQQVDKVNTFQCVLASNGTSSYVIFLYLDNGLKWYQADDRDGVPAQVGFNKGCNFGVSGDDIMEESGCGVYLVLAESMTADVTSLDEKSNIAGASAGLYMWRVSSSKIVDGFACSNQGIEGISISPNFGHQFGGTPIIISGPCYKTTDEVQCVFGGGQIVEGLIVDSEEALCVSPPMAVAETVTLELRLNNVAIAATSFSIVPYYDGADVTSPASTLLIKGGDDVSLSWDPSHLFPTAPTNAFKVNIVMHSLLNPQTDSPAHWVNSSTLLLNLQNLGSAVMEIPMQQLLPLTDPQTQSPYALVMFKVVFVPSQSSSNKYISALSEIESLGTSESAGLWTNVFFLVVREEGDYCDKWSNANEEDSSSSFSSLVSGDCDECVPSCPCNEAQASLPNSGFVSLMASPGMSVLSRYLFQDSSVCFVSVEARSSSSADVYDPSQICCYNDEGFLMVGLPNGGYQSAVSPLSPTKPWSHHFLFDISPYVGCCLDLPLSSTCLLYYTQRPSDNCENFSPWRPGWLAGDPHIITLDGHQYTFNGRGEFTLMETSDDSFTLQGRMVPLATPQGQSNGTVFSSIAAVSHETGDRIELRAGASGIRVLVNGVLKELSTGLSHYFPAFTVSVTNDVSVGVLFGDGVSIDVVQKYGYFSSVLLSVSIDYANATAGLLGDYNGDPSNDLLPSDSMWPLPTDSTSQDIHYKFGLSWIVSDSSKSLFTYDQSDSFNAYYQPAYSPVFEVTFANSSLQALAQNLCQGSDLCLFDAAATANIEVGVATLEESKKIGMIIEISKPIICDPACVNGACVANNSCYCSYGYQGESCNIPVYKSCGNDSNPCQNGATCSLHLFSSYTCSCVPSYTGQYCETADCGELESDSPFLSISYDSTVSGSVAVFSCPLGYRLVGNKYSMCLANTSWTFGRQHCVIVDCGVPSSDNQHLSVSFFSTIFTAVSTYSCAEGYLLRGPETRQCEDSGQWSGEQPICLINCGAPPEWGHGVTVQYNDTAEGSVAVYQCENSDYDLLGPENNTCLHNGTWSEEIIECRAQDDSLLYIIIGSSIGGASVVFLLIVVIVTTIALILHKCRAIKLGKSELELTEI